MASTFPADPNALPVSDWDPFFAGFYKASGSAVENYPWLSHGVTIAASARRSANGGHVVAKSLLKGVVAALSGGVQSAWWDPFTRTLWAELKTTDERSGRVTVTPCLLQTSPLKIMAPYHSPSKPNYYSGALFLLEGLAHQVPDLLEALEAVVKLVASYPDGKLTGSETEQALVARLADEVAYSMAFLDQPPTPAVDRRRGPVDVIRTVGNGVPTQDPPPVSDEALAIDLTLFSRPASWPLARARGAVLLPRRQGASRYAPMPDSLQQFAGPQAQEAWQALQRGKILYFGGPAGTGKTYLAQLLATALGRRLIILPCSDIMDDVSVVGGVIPFDQRSEWYETLLMSLGSFSSALGAAPSDAARSVGAALDGVAKLLVDWKPEIRANVRSFVYGPLGEALRAAGEGEKVVLLIDELRRLDPVHVVSFLHAFQPKDRVAVQAMGYDTGDQPGPFYVLPVPQSATLVTPCDNLAVIAASNEGANYLLKKLDPAFRERFMYRIEFNYPPVEEEIRLMTRNVPGFDDPSMLDLAQVLARFAEWTRQAQLIEGFPGCVSTRTLLSWARDVTWLGPSAAIDQVWQYAKANFGDLVAGQDGLGFVMGERWDTARLQFEALWIDAGLAVTS